MNKKRSKAWPTSSNQKMAKFIRYNNSGEILEEHEFPFRFCWGENPPLIEISIQAHDEDKKIIKDGTYASMQLTLTGLIEEVWPFAVDLFNSKEVKRYRKKHLK